MLTEAEGCAVLKSVFERRGFVIVENLRFSEGAVSFTADGWDAGARVGYEYLTHAQRDHDDLGGAALAELGRRMEAGELYFFIVDETEGFSADELGLAADAFLAEVLRRRADAAGVSS